MVRIFIETNSVRTYPIEDITFYVKTVDESKPVKYGVVKVAVEGCKIITKVVSTKNLYLSADGERLNQ